MFRYANSFICFLAFGSMGLLVQGLRHSLNEHLRPRRELEKTLEELNRSTEEVRKLQGQLQVVCAWTKRVKFQGKWVSFEDYLHTRFNLRFTHGISEEASRNLEMEAVEFVETDSAKFKARPRFIPPDSQPSAEST